MTKSRTRLMGLGPIAVGGAVIAGMIVQLHLGKTGRHWLITRDAEPVAFWSNVAIWGAVGVGLVGLGIYTLLYGDPGRKP